MTGTNGSAGNLPDLDPEEEARCEELIAELTDPTVRCALSLWTCQITSRCCGPGTDAK